MRQNSSNSTSALPPENSYHPVKPLSYFCPVACGCRSGDAHCPDACPARNGTETCEEHQKLSNGGACPMAAGRSVA